MNEDPHDHTLYTLGYSQLSDHGSRGPCELKEIAVERNAFVLDIRFNARSRQPHWNSGNLMAVIGTERYAHCQHLGNANYRSDGPIEIADPATGLAVLERLLQASSVILLCQCYAHSACHRATVAQMAATAFKLTPAHLYIPRPNARPRTGKITPAKADGQGKLF